MFFGTKWLPYLSVLNGINAMILARVPVMTGGTRTADARRNAISARDSTEATVPSVFYRRGKFGEGDGGVQAVFRTVTPRNRIPGYLISNLCRGGNAGDTAIAADSKVIQETSAGMIICLGSVPALREVANDWRPVERLGRESFTRQTSVNDGATRKCGRLVSCFINSRGTDAETFNLVAPNFGQLQRRIN